MLGVEEYSGVEGELFSCTNEVSTTKKKKKKKRDKKKRFSDDQIKSLELMFENETRLGPRKKLQLARELGLQPRQVAIWFQNKRARWKSKQLGRDYSILLSNYNGLASRFESLKKEKQALQMKIVQQLKERIQKPTEENQHSGESMAINSADLESENGETARSESEVQPCISMGKSENVLGVLSDEDSALVADYFGLEGETGIINMVEPADGRLTSTEDWGTFEPGLFDQASSGYQWLDFWS